MGHDHKKKSKVYKFVAKLNGGNEVPPNSSQTTGRFYGIFKKETLYYKLVLENITGLTVAHIHLGQPGVNGPPVAFLYGPVGPSGLLCKVEIRGKIRSCDLVGPLVDDCIDALLREMKDGNTYVNVHTEEFPGGVVRGQIEKDRHKNKHHHKKESSCSSSSSSSESSSSCSSSSESSSSCSDESSESCGCNVRDVKMSQKPQRTHTRQPTTMPQFKKQVSKKKPSKSAKKH